ncbi:MAG: putative lipid II flippase FtsW [Gracilibacteraceae bacterium]|jgi:cell division protein FtsW|nr:putative lipid II flippase FtsW [Gracilibacteraceae bacterium]
MAKYKRKKPDAVIIFLTLVILAIGITMIMTSSSAFAINNTNPPDPYYFVKRQIMLAGIGAAGAVVAILMPYRFFRLLAVPGVILSAGAFALLRTDFAVEVNDAYRWINVAGIQFQPSETAKVALILFLAWWMARRPVSSIKQIILPLILIGAFLLFILKEPDLGTAIVIAGGCACLLLQTRISPWLFVAVTPVAAAAVAWKVSTTPYQMARVIGWLNPWENSAGIGLQYVQSQLAFARGGLFGVGIGASEQKYRLPESHTDSIFAIIGEELGFFLALLLVVLFALLLFRCFDVASKCRDDFGRYLAFGLTAMTALQVCVNMSVMTGLMPITGLTLPLVSYGGTSLVITMLSIGMIVSVSRG